MLCPACNAVSTGAGRCGTCGAVMPLPDEERVLDFPVAIAVPLDRRVPEGGSAAVPPAAVTREIFLDRREELRVPEPSALGPLGPMAEAATRLIRHAVPVWPPTASPEPGGAVELPDALERDEDEWVGLPEGEVEEAGETTEEILLPPAPPAWRRLLAWGIDGAIVLAALLAPLVAATHGAIGGDGVPLGLFDLLAGSGPMRAAAVTLAAVMAFVYLTLSSAAGGRTPGASLAGLELVACESGTPPGPGRAALRAALAVVGCLAFFAGPLSALLDGRGRALHDKLAGTVVLVDR